MPFTHNGPVRLHWAEQGSGTPVLLMMGMRYSSRMWYPVIPALAQKHRVLYYDNRGTGQSDAPTGFTVGDMVDDALAVMDAAGVESAHLYGVSMGGGVAMELAIRHPQRVRSLILGLIKTETHSNRHLAWLFRLPRPLVRLLAWMLLGRGKDYGSADAPDQVVLADAVLHSDPYSGRGVAGQVLAVGAYATTLDAARKLTMPALVLHGDEDKAVKVEAGRQIAEVLPNARLEVFKGASHNFFLADTTRANRLVLEFLAKNDAAI